MGSGELGHSSRSYAGSGELMSSGKASDASIFMSGSLSSTSSMDISTKSSLSSCVTMPNVGKSSLSGKISAECAHMDPKRKSLENQKASKKWDSFGETRKSSPSRGSSDLGEVSDGGESVHSSRSSALSKPHKANDSKWEAIQAVRVKEGALGLNHFRLLKKLGSGDIGSVYLSELRGRSCYFAMKVMDK
eukprot:c12301_g1_i1 orf=424-993(+)